MTRALLERERGPLSGVGCEYTRLHECVRSVESGTDKQLDYQYRGEEEHLYSRASKAREGS